MKLSSVRFATGLALSGLPGQNTHPLTLAASDRIKLVRQDEAPFDLAILVDDKCVALVPWSKCDHGVPLGLGGANVERDAKPPRGKVALEPA